MKIQPMLNERGLFSNTNKYEKHKMSLQEYKDRRTGLTGLAIFLPLLLGTLIGFISTDFFFIGAAIGFFIGLLISLVLLIIVNVDNIDKAEINGFTEEAEKEKLKLKVGAAATVAAGIKIVHDVKDAAKDIGNPDGWKEMK